jgi:hypothetical protein
MIEFIHIILQSIIESIIKYLGKLYLPKLRECFAYLKQQFTESAPITLSDAEINNLRIRYLIVLAQFICFFLVGMSGHFVFFPKPQDPINIYRAIGDILSMLLTFFSLLKFIQGIRIREKFEGRGFRWW